MVPKLLQARASIGKGGREFCSTHFRTPLTPEPSIRIVIFGVFAAEGYSSITARATHKYGEELWMGIQHAAQPQGGPAVAELSTG